MFGVEKIHCGQDILSDFKCIHLQRANFFIFKKYHITNGLLLAFPSLSNKFSLWLARLNLCYLRGVAWISILSAALVAFVRF